MAKPDDSPGPLLVSTVGMTYVVISFFDWPWWAWLLITGPIMFAIAFIMSILEDLLNGKKG